MNDSINLLLTDKATLGLAAASVIWAGLFIYADGRVSVLHQQEKQFGPDRNGRNDKVYQLFFLSSVGVLISFVLLIYRAPLMGLLTGLSVFGLALIGLSSFFRTGLSRLTRKGTGWRWFTSLQQARVGLLCVGSLGITCLVEEECLFSSLGLTGGPLNSFPQVVPDTTSDLIMSPLASGLVILTLFTLGSAFCRATVRMQTSPVRLKELQAYSWRTDSLLRTYSTLLVLQFALMALISFSSIPVHTFWFGYALVAIGQLIPASRRGSERLLGMIESIFQSSRRARAAR